MKRETNMRPRPTMTQTIKISRATADAMRYSRPKRRGAQVLVTLLLVLAIVGMATYWTKG